jgi:hypothetical protein
MKTRVECLDCDWCKESLDRAWTLHAGRVHAQMLRPHHRVTEVTLDGKSV